MLFVRPGIEQLVSVNESCLMIETLIKLSFSVFFVDLLRTKQPQIFVTLKSRVEIEKVILNKMLAF